MFRVHDNVWYGDGQKKNHVFFHLTFTFRLLDKDVATGDVPFPPRYLPSF